MKKQKTEADPSRFLHEEFYEERKTEVAYEVMDEFLQRGGDIDRYDKVWWAMCDLSFGVSMFACIFFLFLILFLP